MMTSERRAKPTQRIDQKAATTNGSPAYANGGRVHGRSESLATPLTRSVADALHEYFQALDGERASGLYDLVMEQVERPLLEIVMGHVEDNQTRAAEMLGLNRGTLRKKLKQHGLLEL